MIQLGPLLVVVLSVFAAATAVLVWLGRLGAWHSIATAAVRATVQLGAVSLLITAVLHSGWLTAAFVLMMFTVASVTSARRFGTWSDTVWSAAAIAAGVAPPLAALILSGLVPATPVAVVPIAGILIGGAMTATTLAGRRALDELKTRHGEYEAALALGLLPRDATLLICRPSAGQALVPALDQTRTVGLVTLPGAFVGVLLGGASPMQAGATQLVVLVSLLLVEAVAVLVIVELIAGQRVQSAGSS
ncbi:ABC transporter permease [Actinosynnema sp. ALI-1.44]|nr:ABC transporter permease [Actinosynnema sp. ALI-1.44]ONI74750.1 ABC transporter permease [Actinosynnema sp. ALI-1.44]